MDLIAKCTIFLVSPVSLLIAQSSYQALFCTLILANPFTIVLLIKALDYIIPSSSFAESRAGAISIARHTRRNDGEEKKRKYDTTNPSISYCCSYNEDKIYLYFKYWLISAHLTLVISFNRYTASSLQISTSELILIFGSYVALHILLINLKNHIHKTITQINSSQKDQDAIVPLTGVKTSSAGQDTAMHYICEGLCYMKKLANPYCCDCTSLADANSKLPSDDVNIHLVGYNDTPINQPDVNFSKTTYTQSKRSANNIFKISHLLFNRLTTNPTKTSYLVTCNVIHMIILALHAYYNLTFTCASNISRFGTALLIPVDCSDIFDNETARTSMFAAVYSAQILCCQMAFISQSVK